MPKASKKSAKAKSTKVAKPEATSKTKRRGGRKPGTWMQTGPEKILAFRKEHKLSRATFAEMVGVSSTSVANWEGGKGAASPAMQSKIVAVMGSAPATVTKSKRAMVGAAAKPTNGQHPSGYDSVVEGTARIVAAFLPTAKLKRQELGAVIRDVRAALA